MCPVIHSWIIFSGTIADFILGEEGPCQENPSFFIIYFGPFMDYFSIGHRHLANHVEKPDIHQFMKCVDANTIDFGLDLE